MNNPKSKKTINKHPKKETKETNCSEEESEQKENRRRGTIFFIGLVVVIILILFGTLYLNDWLKEKKSNENKYNNFQFYYIDTLDAWMVQVELRGAPYDIPFHYHPKELNLIDMQEGVENIILANPPSDIIISVPFDSNAQIALAGIEIAKITGSKYDIFNIPTSSAINELVEGFPYATCEDADEDTVVISFQKSDKTIVTSEERCIILLYSEDEDAIKVADLLSYKLLRIM